MGIDKVALPSPENSTLANIALIGQSKSFDSCCKNCDHDDDDDVFRFSQRPFQHLCLFSNP